MDTFMKGVWEDESETTNKKHGKHQKKVSKRKSQEWKN